jgi:hypothetical protein
LTTRDISKVNKFLPTRDISKVNKYLSTHDISVVGGVVAADAAIHLVDTAIG